MSITVHEIASSCLKHNLNHYLMIYICCLIICLMFIDSKEVFFPIHLDQMGENFSVQNKEKIFPLYLYDLMIFKMFQFSIMHEAKLKESNLHSFIVYL